MPSNDLKRFANLKYEDFKTLAKDQTLSRYEKIGFPDTYRKGKEESIFRDITIIKLKNLNKKNQTIADIGSGYSELAFMIINFLLFAHKAPIIFCQLQPALCRLGLSRNCGAFDFNQGC